MMGHLRDKLRANLAAGAKASKKLGAPINDGPLSSSQKGQQGAQPPSGVASSVAPAGTSGPAEVISSNEIVVVEDEGSAATVQPQQGAQPPSGVAPSQPTTQPATQAHCSIFELADRSLTGSNQPPPAPGPALRTAKRSGNASFLNPTDDYSPLKGCKLQYLCPTGSTTLKFQLIGKTSCFIDLELNKPVSHKFELSDGRQAEIKLTYTGKNQSANAHEVTYEIEYEVLEKAHKSGALRALARKAGSGFLTHLPHVIIMAAGAAIAALGLVNDFLRDTLKGGFYPAIGAVFAVIEAFAISSLYYRVKEEKEQKE